MSRGVLKLATLISSTPPNVEVVLVLSVGRADWLAGTNPTPIPPSVVAEAPLTDTPLAGMLAGDPKDTKMPAGMLSPVVPLFGEYPLFVPLRKTVCPIPPAATVVPLPL